MTTKFTQPIFFQTDLNWLNNTTGALTSTDATGVLQVSTPPAFGGEGKPWTPEHLFLGAISSCFMTTYLAIAKKIKFEIKSMVCEAIGQVEWKEGKYRICNINLYPKIRVAGEDVREKAELALQKAIQHCLISHSVNADIFYHPEILIDKESRWESTIAVPRSEILL